jgi:hypothetical protein
MTKSLLLALLLAFKLRHIGQGCAHYTSAAGFGLYKNLASYLVVMVLSARISSFNTNTVFFPQKV